MMTTIGGRVLYPVWVKFHDIPIIAFTKDGLSDIATKLDTPLMLDSYTLAMFMDSWGRSSYARAMVELRANVELKDTLLVDVPKFVGETYTISSIRVEYERTPPRCSSCKVFGHVLDECPKKIVSDVLKNSKSPRQDVEGVHVGLKLGSKVQFKLTKQVYQHVSKKNGVSSSGRKKQVELKSAMNFEQLKDTCNYDPYDDDDFDDCGLTDTQMKFANSFDICLPGQIR
ncbi:putative reverse transcriptase domain-containing protein [Tanacetum coccineum]